ncbi:MAG TPA: M1 family aminopeptidase [Cyclobacteriaceae bacterium]|nr:M1 family aminopeptidase [Cyclobacteriaceae bacterium]
MMFWEIFFFELNYRRVRPVTYIYVGVIFLLSFFIVTNPTLKLSGSIGHVNANAPYVIAYLTMAFSLFFTMITSSVMGVAVVRDFENNTEAIMFSTPMTKGEYLFGRFAGSLVVLVLMNLAAVIGMVVGFTFGKYLPWEMAWRFRELAPFSLWAYLQPFLLFTIVNIFTTGAFFFLSGALWRKSIIIYTQGILLLILYQISSLFLADLNLKDIASLIDPFGVQTFFATTMYWTPAEQNNTLVPLSGRMLLNRSIWIGLGIVALLITYKSFSFNVVRTALRKRKHSDENPARYKKPDTVTIRFKLHVVNTSMYWKQLLSLTAFYFRLVWRELPFIAIVLSGVLLLLINATRINHIYGTSSYPTTNAMLTLISNSFNLFLSIIAIFYSGELIWKERDVRFNLIMDAAPMLDLIGLLSKFLSLLMVYSSILLVLIGSGIAVQAFRGFYEFQIPVYFETLFSQTLSALAIYTALFFFIQILVNNKFLGFALSVLFLLLNTLLPQLGIEHSLWRMGSGSLGVFSDMNMYGHFVAPFVWLKLYWTGAALILFFISVLLAVRGAEEGMKTRWATSRLRITPFLKSSITLAALLFVCAGGYFFYNSNILNRFEKTTDLEKHQASYESAFKMYDSITQPKIVECNLHVELYPSKRNFSTEGYYYLKNKSARPIKELHVQHSPKLSEIEYLTFDAPAHITRADEDFRHFVYDLDSALQPGDSIKMSFKFAFLTKGFVDGKSNTDIVYNGTFLNNSYLPSLGYNKNFGITDEGLRQKYNLGHRTKLASFDDPKATSVNLFGDDADHIRFDATIGTENDQIAIAPGYLQRQWTENDRAYFKYSMDKPMANFFSIVSGRYAVTRDKWNNVDLEIYYHPAHKYNLQRMTQGMKDALQYYSKNYSPFQFRQLRITEFPRYMPFAQSFATTIPFSEGLGFIMKIDDPKKDLDMVYYLTAHEVAHQWWGHQVMEADAPGGSLLSEGLAQYSALMVLKHASSEAAVQQYLRYELDNYLKGRALEKNQERPLVSVEKQAYIYYNKASLVFYALQDYVGETNLNHALAEYNHAWAYRESQYPTARDLVNQIRKVTPDSLQYLIDDMFENITLFDNKTRSVLFEERPDGQYDVTLTLSNLKVRADNFGTEQEIPMHDWIDVGIYSMEEGAEKLVYLKKHLIAGADTKILITVKGKPSRAGIDPLGKLVDRHPDDNVASAHKIIGIENLVVR